MKTNPFLVGNYISPKYFCNREKETETIINAFNNQRNLTLISHRRYGKTGLIWNVFYNLNQQGKTKTAYVDLLYTNNLRDFNTALAKAIIGKFDNKITSVLKAFGRIVKSLKPIITINPDTGVPDITVDYFEGVSPELTTEEIFRYLKKQKAPLLIALDEFQQIGNYPEENVEALLRSHIQQLNSTSFIFSGSQKRIITQMFTNPKKPFYQSTEMLFIDKIDENAYAAFIKKLFVSNKIKIDKLAISEILKLTYVHTYYVQFLCNKLFGNGLTVISADDVKNQMNQISKSNEPIYFSIKNLLSKQQLKLLIAISKEGVVEKPTAAGFIAKYSLTATSSVKTALGSLLEKEMVFEENGVYQMYDIFFANFLKKL